jgi:cell shape-determining protein MreD
VLTPLTAPLAISLPAILVAAVGIEAGPSAGLSVGFSTGLLADLGSQHPAGLLAIAWLFLGTVCGLFAEARRRAARSIAIVTVATTIVSIVVVIGLGLFNAPPFAVGDAIRLTAPTLVGDGVLALLLIPAVRAMLRALRVRAPRPSTAAAAIPVGRVAVDG